MSYTVHPNLHARLRVKDTEKVFMLGCLSISIFHQNQAKHAPGVTEESVLILKYTF